MFRNMKIQINSKQKESKVIPFLVDPGYSIGDFWDNDDETVLVITYDDGDILNLCHISVDDESLSHFELTTIAQLKEMKLPSKKLG